MGVASSEYIHQGRRQVQREGAGETVKVMALPIVLSTYECTTLVEANIISCLHEVI